MFGLYKVHKFNSSTRDAPTFRSILSATYLNILILKKFLYQFLKDTPLTSLLYVNHFNFVMKCENKIRLYTWNSLTCSYFLSNISLDETIDICVNRVLQHKKIKRMLKRNVQQFLTLTLKYSYFAFNNMYYKQILGVIMDSPLGPTFANLFWPFM